MRRIQVAVAAIALLAAAPAHAQQQQPQWNNGAPADLVAADRETWSLDASGGIRSNTTGLLCPATLAGATLAGARDMFGGECLYDYGEQGNIWVTSLAAPEAESRAELGRVYEQAATNPAIQITQPERSTLGACDVELRRMENDRGFFLAATDLYRDDATIQVRVTARSDANRGALAPAAQELVNAQTSCHAATTP